MLRLSDVLQEGAIRVPLAAREPRSIVEELVDAIPSCRNRALRDEVVRRVLERESLESTAIGHGVAFPHGMAPVGPHVLVALGVTAAPVEYDSFDGQPVRIVLLIVGSEENRRAQLRVLSLATTLLHEPAFRERLIAARDAADALDIVRRAEAEESGGPE